MSGCEGVVEFCGGVSRAQCEEATLDHAQMGLYLEAIQHPRGRGTPLRALRVPEGERISKIL